MRDVELEVPEALLSEAGRRFGWKQKRKPIQSQKTETFDLRERKSMLRLIVGLAMQGYRYDPKALRSSIPKEISDNLDLIGLPLDTDTIRKYLREGQELLPPEFFGEDDPIPKEE